MTRPRPFPLRVFAAAVLMLLCAVALGAAGNVARAQTATAAPDYTAWETLASRAENIVEAGRASSSALENLRRQLADWRTELQAAQSANSARIATLGTQIEALGPLPEEGATETDEIAARRRALDEQLAQARAPAVVAEEAYRRADGLIGEIDAIISGRKATRLFELGPTPLNPANWPGTFAALGELTREVRDEIAQNWQSEPQQVQRKQDAPIIVVLLILAAVMLTRGRRWFLSFVKWIVPRDENIYRREVRWVLVSLSSFAVPMLGLLALVLAIDVSGLLGLRGDALLGALPGMGLFLFGSRWLASVIFASDGRAPKFGFLPPEKRAAARRIALLLGVFLAVAVLLSTVLEQPIFPDEARLVLGFPVILLMGLMLVRLGRLSRTAPAPDADGDESRAFRDRALDLLARAMVAVGIAGPVLAGIGYFHAGGFFVFPSVMSLTLIALLTILHRLIVNLMALAAGADPEAGQRESMAPVLVGALLVLLAVPLFAMIWGTRAAQLAEYWALVRDGFAIGDVEISFGVLMTFILVFVLGYMITRLIQGALRSSVLPRTKIDVGAREAIVTGTGYVGIVLAALIAITTAGINLSSLAIVAGALSVGIGFGLQTIVSNFVSGIILLIERPIKKGDWVEVGGVHGYVGDISVRSTRIETFDRSDVIVPNADLIAGRVTNYTHGNLAGRAIVKVGVAYGSDTREVEKILLEIAEAHPMVLMNPPPYVIFTGFGADALDFEIRAILRDVNWVLNVKSDMHHEIARRFGEEGIEVPFAQRDIWLRNPEALQGQGGGHGTAPRDAPDTARNRPQPPAGVDGDPAADGGDA